MQVYRFNPPPLAPLHLSFVLFAAWILRDMYSEWQYRPYDPIRMDNVFLWVVFVCQVIINTVHQYKSLSSEMILVSSSALSCRMRALMVVVSWILAGLHTGSSYFLIVFGVFVRPTFMYTWLFSLFSLLFLIRFIKHHVYRFLLLCKSAQGDGLI